MKTLSFYIEEGNRTKINKLNFDLSDSSENLLSELTRKLILDIDDNNNYYDFDLISNFIENSNYKFAQNNQPNQILDFSIIANEENIDITFKELQRIYLLQTLLLVAIQLLKINN